jgi:hypothetical protein
LLPSKHRVGMEDSDRDVAVEQEAIVSRFASMMAAESGQNASRPLSTAAKNDLLSCFADSLGDDAVVCTLPSFEVKAAADSNNPLPEVGQSGGLHPIMEASVLTSSASGDVVTTEQKAAQRLCGASSWTKSSIEYASQALLKNVTDSFSSLMDSRVRSWTLLMFRQSLSSGDSSSRTNVMKMLSASFKINSSKSSFKTLSMPDTGGDEVKEYDVILPLIFEVTINVSLADKLEVVKLFAPGTVSGKWNIPFTLVLKCNWRRLAHFLFLKGNFAQEFPKALEKVVVTLDSEAVVGSMVEKARLVVFKTVASVTAADLKVKRSDPDASAAAPMLNLSGGFSSSLRLTSSQATNSPRLAKARSSALRLNSVLQGTSPGTGNNANGIRKQRSVQWDHPMEMPSIQGSVPPCQKKPRMEEAANRLKSFKSFGRPHADDNMSGPRNATFGNFGRQPIWGRDGKLANHPMPENALDRTRQDLQMGEKVTGSVNATFGATSTPGSRLLAGVSSNRNASVARLPSSIPRTATALEMWLLNAAGGK